MKKRQAGIIVGTSKETVTETKRAIMEILRTKETPEVKVEALKSLAIMCKIENTTISGCEFR